MKTVSIVTGIAFAILGCICFAFPGMTASFVTYLISFVVLLAGIAMIVSYFVNKNSVLNIGINKGWALFYGIVMTLLGLFLVFNPDFNTVMVSTFMGIAVIVHGAIKIFNSNNLRIAGMSWVPLLIFGILSLLLGLFMLCHPIITFISLGIIIAVSLLIEGITYIVVGISL